MTNNQIVELIQPLSIYDGEKFNTWDIGELFIYRKSEKKRHGDGNYPCRLISLNDASMLAMSAIRKREYASKKSAAKEAE